MSTNAPSAPDARPSGPNRWATWGWPGAVFVVLVGVYAATTPRTVALEDDGLFIMSSYVLGVAHPPGYPLHTLLGHLFTYLPFGTMAFRVHLLSGVLGALACGVLWWLVVELTGRRPLAFLVALAYGCSEAFWSQAIIAEVYTLNALFFFLLLALAVRYAAAPSRRLLYGLAFTYGLALTNHLPLIGLTTPGLAVILWPRVRDVLRGAPKAAAFGVLGLLPYGWMVIRSQMEPRISFYGPIRSLSEFWYVITRAGYSQLDASPSAGWWDKLQFTAFLSQEALGQMTALGLLLALVGAAASYRSVHRTLWWGLLAALVGNSVVLILLLGLDYDFLQQTVVRVYPLAAYGVLAIWMAWGLERVGAWSGRWLPGREAWVSLGLGAAVVALTFGSHWQANDRRTYRAADDFGRAVLASLEPDAIFFTFADLDTGPIGYLNLIEGVRPDVTLYNTAGLIFSPRLYDPRTVRSRAKPHLIRRFVQGTSRPIYHAGEWVSPHGATHFGAFWKIEPKLPKGKIRHELVDALVELVHRPHDDPDLRDRMTRHHHNTFVAQITAFLTAAMEAGDPALAKRARRHLPWLQEWYPGRLEIVSSRVQRAPTPELKEVRAQVEALRGRDDPTMVKSALSRPDYLAGFLEYRLGNLPAAVEAFRRSVEMYPNPKNASVAALLKLYPVLRRQSEYAALRLRFPKVKH